MSLSMTDLQQQTLINKSLASSGMPLNTLNSAISSVNNSVACGADCQAQKRDETLRRAYLSAKDNVKNAPTKLQIAEKEYYVKTKGEDFYNNLLEKRYTNEAQELKEKQTLKHKKQMKEIKTLNKDLDANMIYYKRINMLRNNLIKQNRKLKREINDEIASIETNDRKTYYETQQLTSQNSWTNLFLVFYWMLLIAFIFVSLFIKNGFKNWRVWLQILVLVLLPYIGISLFISIIIYIFDVLETIWIMITGQSSNN